MANRQSVPSMANNGVMVLQPAKATPAPAGLKREYAGNEKTEFMAQALVAGAQFLEKMRENDFENMGYETDQVLQNYRSQLVNAKSADEFDMISKAAEDDLSSRFSDRFNGPEFWSKHGANILKANKNDVEKLREKKNFDFGKDSLNSMLSSSQNMLARTSGDKGETLLSRAVAEIDTTPFLQTQEKQQYRNDYLKTGILNLALNDPDKAQAMADKFLPTAREELTKRINDTRALREAFAEEEKEREQREADIAEFRQAFSYWQAKEEGTIKPAEFYVLTAENKPDTLWGERENRSNTPLADAYRIIKKINGGSKLSAEELRNAGNYLISAYKQKKLGLEEVSE